MARNKPTQAGGGVKPGTTEFKRESPPPKPKPAATAGGGVRPGTTNFVYNKPSGAAPKPPKWTVSGPIGGSPQPTGGTDVVATTPIGRDQPMDTTDPYTEFLKAQAAEEKRLRSINAIAAMRGLMDTYGLGTLMGKIQTWITDGYEADAIMALIRQTPEYETRFPAMKALASKGRAISEAEYIAYEQTAAQYESLYGLPTGMLTSKDRITDLLSKEISARELEERTVKASQSQYALPEEYRRTFREYYGVDSGGLTAYFLDPEVATPLLEKQFVSAQIGSEAAMQGVGVGADVSEMLYQQGIAREQAREGFQRVAGAQELTTGRGDVVTQGDLITGTMLGNAQAQANMERAAGARVGRFQGGGQFATTQQGVVGLGSAATR